MSADLSAAAERYDAAYKSTVLTALDDLSRANPDLAALPVNRDNLPQVRDVVMGALSGFNPDDIRAFSIDKKDGVFQQNNPDFTAKRDAVQQAGGVPLSWIPAEKTMDIISDKLAARGTPAQGRHSNPAPEVLDIIRANPLKVAAAQQMFGKGVSSVPAGTLKTPPATPSSQGDRTNITQR